MLRLLFEAHKNIMAPPESPFILNLYKKYIGITLWNEVVIREFVDDLFKQMYFDKWLINREELIKRLMKLSGKCTFQDIVMQVYQSYNSVFEKEEIKFICDKNPIYSLYVDRIHKLFPESKIIHITRDYRDNYLSLTKVNFEIPVVPIVIYRWKFAVRKMWKLKAKHPNLIYSVRYEDLAADPELHTRKLCDFLGINFDPAVLDFYKKKKEYESLYAGAEGAETVKKIHKSLLNPISTTRMNKWQTEMTSRQIRIADMVAGKTAEKAGYERMYKGLNPFLYLWISPALVYSWLMYKAMLLGEHLPYKTRNSLINFLGLFLKAYWWMNRKKLNPI